MKILFTTINDYEYEYNLFKILSQVRDFVVRGLQKSTGIGIKDTISW